MIRNDIAILRSLPHRAWYLIVKALTQYDLYPYHITYPRATRFIDALHNDHITMADIVYTLNITSRTDPQINQAFQTLLSKLTPNTKLPDSILPLLDPKYTQHITAVYPEFLPPNYTPLYRVGVTLADLILLYGIPEQQIQADVDSGGLVLSPLPLYTPSDEAYAPPSTEETT